MRQSFYDTLTQSKYNKTKYSGLENTLPNSYLNSLLQLFNYIPALRRSCQNHLCEEEHCLCCELGLLYKNIENSEGKISEARNFLRSLYYIPRGNNK